MPRVTKVVDARRLTGPNLDLPGAGAVIEVALEPSADDGLGALVTALQAAVSTPISVRQWHDGAALATPGPIDCLYEVVDRLEAVAKAFVDFPATARVPNPALLALQAAAAAGGVPFLWDDEQVSVGHGASTQVFPTGAIPPVDTIDLSGARRVPVALVTGTNGKTTTTRMLAKILGAAGHVVGTSSTDAITVGDALVEAGDWTGPGAARRVLRDPRVTAAVLESARGGMLRRGLAVSDADVAVVTNVAEDHFGEHGVADLATMMRTKAVVYGAVRPTAAGGRCVLNADDPTAVAWARANAIEADPERWILLTDALVPDTLAHEHLVRGGVVYCIDSHHLTRTTRAATQRIIGIPTIPASFGGSAHHNVQNALAAAAMAHALRVDDTHVSAALAAFGKHPLDNPGRAEHYLVGGVHYLFDFSHNPHGVDAIAPLVAHLRVPGSRLSVAAGQAGDRSDADLTELAVALMRWAPERVYLRDLRGYERGRADGEVARVMRAAFVAAGLTDEQIHDVPSELAALEGAYVWARPGDLVVHIVHIERDEVRAWLAAHEAQPA